MIPTRNPKTGHDLINNRVNNHKGRRDLLVAAAFIIFSLQQSTNINTRLGILVWNLRVVTTEPVFVEINTLT